MRSLTPLFAFVILLWCVTARAAQNVNQPDAGVNGSQSSLQVHSSMKRKTTTKQPGSADMLTKTTDNHPSISASGTAPVVERVSLPEVAREAMAIHFHASQYQSFKELLAATPVCKEYKQPAGLFVTLSRNGKTRACWGSIYAQDHDNLVEATVSTTEKALTKDYRYQRIRPSEWKFLKPQVTIIRDIEPIANMSQQNPLEYGLLVRYGGRGAVLLPGEASDAHYQLVRTKLKAGIPVGQPCQLYRIRADVLR
jgi:AMMECR1 domain-containing protein